MNVLHDLFQGGLNRNNNEQKLATQVNTGRHEGKGGLRGQREVKSLDTAKSYKVTGKSQKRRQTALA